MRSRPTCLCAIALSFLTAPVSGASFHDIGDLPGGLVYSSATAVTPDGRMVIGESHSDQSTDDDDEGEAVYWTKETGLVALGLPPGATTSKAYGVSADGSTVVGLASTGSFTWTASAGTQDSFLSPPGVAYAVASDGTTMAGYTFAQSPVSTRWTAHGAQQLFEPDSWSGGSRKNFDISADGSVIVTFRRIDDEQLTRPIRWTETGGAEVIPLPATALGGLAQGVSSNGTFVVGYAGYRSDIDPPNSEAVGFRWSEAEGYVELGSLAEVRDDLTIAYAASADGSVVVGQSRDDALEARAFIWDQMHGIRNLQQVLIDDFGLDLTGWTLTDAMDISDDGLTIIGRGFYGPENQVKGWIATVPEPSTFLIASMAALGIFCHCYTRRRNEAR
jgi:probable HAF family extracellular repeat protein